MYVKLPWVRVAASVFNALYSAHHAGGLLIVTMLDEAQIRSNEPAGFVLRRNFSLRPTHGSPADVVWHT